MLIVFGALKIELDSIIESTRIKKKIRVGGVCLYLGILKDKDVLIVVTGIGKDSALKAVDIAFRQEPVRAAGNIDILITGFCGGASRGLNIGDLVAYKKVLDLAKTGGMVDKEECAEPDQRKFFDLPAARTIKGISPVTCGCTDHVVSTPEEKMATFDAYGADVIDMESYWLIKGLTEKQIPLERICCIRAVSDDSQGRLPIYFSSDTSYRMIAMFIRSVFISAFSRRERRANIYFLQNLLRIKNTLNYDNLWCRNFINKPD